MEMKICFKKCVCWIKVIDKLIKLYHKEISFKLKKVGNKRHQENIYDKHILYDFDAAICQKE